MVLADYRCGCTWVGLRRECMTYCARHGENRQQVITLPKASKDHGLTQLGWDWQHSNQSSTGGQTDGH